MIMGGGKTSVVSPLLGLMLADGKRLVSLIVPDSLLKQSKDEIQTKFVQIITKQVTEFRFQRMTEPHDKKMNHPEDGYLAHAKLLRAARAQRAIVCAGPSSMKSMMLELVDVLQRLEATLSGCAEARLPVLPVARTDVERYRERDLKRCAAEAVQQLVVNPDEVRRERFYEVCTRG